MIFKPSYLFLTPLLTLALMAFGHSSIAQAEILIGPTIEVEMLTEQASLQPGAPFSAALRMKPTPGWHIYWRYAGDSGSAPKTNWTLNDTAIEGHTIWPYPKRIPFGPLVNFGYEKETLLITDFVAPRTLSENTAATLKVDAEWLVCQEECIPGNGVFSVTLPVRATAPEVKEDLQALFRNTRALVPSPLSSIPLSARFEEDHFLLDITPPSHFDRSLLQLTFFPDHGGIIENASPQTIRADGERISLLLTKDQSNEEISHTLEGVLVANQPWEPNTSIFAIEINVVVSGLAPNQQKPKPISATATTPRPIEEDASLSMWSSLLFAFLGGIILNLMPCVFPILSIKILGFVEAAGSDTHARVLHSLVFGLGVILSFLGLAISILALQAAGTSLGWGFQLQSPAFVALMTLLLFAIGLNLAGLFEFGSSLQRIGGRIAPSEGYFGSFASGVLATVLATPCTAPFMGSAIAYAFTLSAPQSLLIFTALGVGMALPYVLLSASPRLLALLPRPGTWMTIFKQIMSFPLFASALWLLWVLSLQTNTEQVLWLLAALLVMAFGLWVRGTFATPSHKKTTRLFAKGFAVLFVVFAAWIAIPSQDSQLRTAATAGQFTDHWGQQWQPFSDTELSSLRAQGKPVFIDFTAAWCITCQVNKRVVFSSEEVRKLIKEKGVALMRADWTSRDDMIATVLQTFGRRGVPLNVLYNGEASEPYLFPAILTPSLVIEQLQNISIKTVTK